MTELLCAAGFWTVITVTGTRWYTDDLRKVTEPIRAAVCRPWTTLPPLNAPVEKPSPPRKGQEV